MLTRLFPGSFGMTDAEWNQSQCLFSQRAWGLALSCAERRLPIAWLRDSPCETWPGEAAVSSLEVKIRPELLDAA